MSKLPLPTHNFIVEIASKSVPFSKIQSIEIGVETEPLIEGGENRFVYSLYKESNQEKILTMERNVASDDTSIKSLRVGTVFDQMHIFVLDQHRRRRKKYEARFVILKKRSLSGLDAMNGDVLVENLEFVYREMTEVPS
ncbi:MAG: phage tail protein [Defluviitaleaceae bacterium]|nr:phage tail protein [Defluviitaleaceae bacterium]